MWAPPGPATEPVSPVMAGRFFTTERATREVSGMSTNRDKSEEILFQLDLKVNIIRSQERELATYFPC